MHLLLWPKQTRQPGHLLFALMAVAAGVSGLTELALLHEQTISGYHRLVRFQHVPLFSLLTSMVWGVQLYFGTGRRWLAWAITGLWSCCLVINYLSPHNLVFREIVELRRVGTVGGEFFTVAHLNGIDALPVLRKAHPRIKVVFLTMHPRNSTSSRRSWFAVE